MYGPVSWRSIQEKTVNVSHSCEETISFIIKALTEPKTFLFDRLLSSKLVQDLKGELIYDLLSIFVNDNLSAYLSFYENHNDFVNSLGLNHQQNIQKMRVLTFMQLAQSNTEISFDVLMEEIQISAEEVEGFVIEALKTKMVRARMDQLAQKVIVMSSMHRTFGRHEWQHIRDVLFSWRNNLASAQEDLGRVAAQGQEK